MKLTVDLFFFFFFLVTRVVKSLFDPRDTVPLNHGSYETWTSCIRAKY